MINEADLKKYKQKYAHLIAIVGLNDIKDKICKVNSDTDDLEFTNMVVKELYLRGAKRVIVNLTYRPILKTIYESTPIDELKKVYNYQKEKVIFECDNFTPSVSLLSADPFWSNGIDASKIVEANKPFAQFAAPYKKKMDEVETPWCLAAVPSLSWAKRLFPNLSDKQALNKMWEKTLQCVRCLDGDPIKNWKQFNLDIKKKAKYLNDLKIDTLHYTSNNGTDLYLGINPHSHFVGGAHDAIGNPPYNPNMPAVECFISPDRLRVNGIVYSTKPLSLNGSIIDKFYLRFKDGKVIEAKAKTGNDYLKKVLNTDEGSCYLGEAALVPFDSPVNKTNVIYYNTLFDENAVCHLALGRSLVASYNQEVRNLTNKELIKSGLNISSIHDDFMIGSKDLNIEATTINGKKIMIFKKGNWAI